MKLTREERYALNDIARAPEGISFCPDEVKNLQNKGLVEVVEYADGNYATITTAGRQVLKGGEYMNETLKNELTYIAKTHGLGLKDIMSHCKFPNVVRARNDAIFFIRIQYGLSVEKIGKIFKMHHSSVSHAINRHVHS